MSVGEEIVADGGATIDGDEAMQHGVAANHSIFVDETIRANVRAFADARAFCNDGRWMNARSIIRRLVKELQSMRKSQIGIGRTESSQRRCGRTTLDRNSFFDKNSGSASGLEKWEVAAIGEKGQVARLGVLDARDAGDFRIRRTFEPASEFLRNSRKFHGEISSRFTLAASESRTGESGKYR
jgi:hypothetical protein